MTNESSPLRLSIWRNFVPKRPILNQDSHSQNPQIWASGSVNLQEEIYAWYTQESPFDGIVDDVTRENLREKLFGKLDASLPPSERGIAVLKEFIEVAETALTDEKAEWTISQNASDDDEKFTDKVNGLLAVTQHLKWLVDCFSDRPGISVSVR